MPFYHRSGKIPHKRHTQFRSESGVLYHEELMGVNGFSGVQSLLYHCLLYTSPSPRDKRQSRMPSSA